jgi:hypothetical protein
MLAVATLFVLLRRRALTPRRMALLGSGYVLFAAGLAFVA